MLGFLAGLVYANGMEWLIHKHLLHEDGKKKGSFWRFHYADHHKNARQNNFIDPDYEKSLLEWNAQSKEVLALLVGAGIHLPMFPVAPEFVSGLWFSMAYYYFVHKKSHEDPDWARKNLPWHYDHHMGKNQDANWCVTFPLFDHIMNTRIPYMGTDEEKQDRERRITKMKEHKLVKLVSA